MSFDDSSASKSLSGSSSAPTIPPPPKASPSPPAAPAVAPVPPQIQDFDALIKGDVQNFVNLGEKIGGLVAEQVCCRIGGHLVCRE
jgi:adenylyl cyclase-associated protein